MQALQRWQCLQFELIQQPNISHHLHLSQWWHWSQLEQHSLPQSDIGLSSHGQSCLNDSDHLVISISNSAELIFALSSIIFTCPEVQALEEPEKKAKTQKGMMRCILDFQLNHSPVSFDSELQFWFHRRTQKGTMKGILKGQVQIHTLGWGLLRFYGTSTRRCL